MFLKQYSLLLQVSFEIIQFFSLTCINESQSLMSYELELESSNVIHVLKFFQGVIISI